MRPLIAALTLAAACAHPAKEPSGAPLSSEIGQTHVPYTGEPASLAPKRQPEPLFAARGDAFTTRMRSPAERQKELRGLLADADALLAADDVAALPPILREMDLLLRPYPDIKAEMDELEKHTVEWESATSLQKLRIKHRMEDLIDLIRLQLFAAR